MKTPPPPIRATRQVLDIGLIDNAARGKLVQKVDVSHSIRSTTSVRTMRCCRLHLRGYQCSGVLR